MVLVNGSEGIGVGWSSSVPCFNPLDIIKNIRHKIHDEEMEEMTPWYSGFIGEIKKVEGKANEEVKKWNEMCIRDSTNIASIVKRCDTSGLRIPRIIS